MRRILVRAAEIGAEHTGSRFIGTENVLRAITEDVDGIAAQVLSELGVLDQVRFRLDEIMRSEEYRRPTGG
ncbi:MAG TPA: Clp protease N-terminal domain-containing protein [Candidatus Limnocylindria bacterium]|jgi:hypothetical protein|nr:Clp protease N-terminal domain-containing protein [Candidatus Limnocylindria bacterium]